MDRCTGNWYLHATSIIFSLVYDVPNKASEKRLNLCNIITPPIARVMSISKNNNGIPHFSF